MRVIKKKKKLIRRIAWSNEKEVCGFDEEDVCGGETRRTFVALLLVMLLLVLHPPGGR